MKTVSIEDTSTEHSWRNNPLTAQHREKLHMYMQAIFKCEPKIKFGFVRGCIKNHKIFTILHIQSTYISILGLNMDLA